MVSPAPASAPVVAVPVAQNGWAASPDAIAAWKPDYHGFAWDLRQAYRKGGSDVGVYVAYYRNQAKGRELVTSGNQLTNMGDFRWKSTARAPEEVDWNGASVPAERTEITGPAVTLDAVRLFWVDGHVTSSPYVAKARLAWARINGRGDDSALIVLYAPRKAGEHPGARLGEFAREMSPAIERALDDVRGRRE